MDVDLRGIEDTLYLGIPRDVSALVDLVNEGLLQHVLWHETELDHPTVVWNGRCFSQATFSLLLAESRKLSSSSFVSDRPGNLAAAQWSMLRYVVVIVEGHRGMGS